MSFPSESMEESMAFMVTCMILMNLPSVDVESVDPYDAVDDMYGLVDSGCKGTGAWM
jgi:hypothetical protein